METEKLIIRKKQTVVTRHRALVAYLLDRDIIKEGDVKIVEHANYKDVEGKDVIGVLPLKLASYAKSITEVPLKLTADMRGKELTFEEVEKVAGVPTKYLVREISPNDGIDYYLDILKGYTDEDYDLAYKYYVHSFERSQSFKDYFEIETARAYYHDIVNAIQGISDILYIEHNNDFFEYDMYRTRGLKFLAELKFLDQYMEDEDGERFYTSKKVIMKDFNRDDVLKFIDELLDMCI